MKTLKLLAASLMTLAALVLPGCVNGHLSPAVAPIAGIVETGACTMVAFFSGSATAGSACSDIAADVQAVVNTLTKLEPRGVGADLSPARYEPIAAPGSATPDVYLRSDYSDADKAKVLAVVTAKRTALKGAAK